MLKPGNFRFETWGKSPPAFFVGERPMMTTLDAPFWLRGARDYNEGIFGLKPGLAECGSVDEGVS